MKEQLSLLVKLQEVDTSIDEEEQLQKSLPKEIEYLKKALEEEQGEYNKKSKEIEEMKRSRMEKDLDVMAYNHRIERYRQQMKGAQPKAYQSLEREVKTMEKKKEAVEDEILNLMIQIEEAERNLNDMRKSLEKKTEDIQKTTDEIQRRLEDSQRRMKEYASQRDDLAQRISPGLYSRYERLRRSKNRAVVQLIDDSCGGCNLTVLPNIVNSVRRDGIESCNNCGRILYIPEGENG
ncbi:MAG: zinc ribbon domain-containing protein [bacterium]